MIPLLLILIPVVCGIAGFFIKDARIGRTWSLLVSLVVLATSLVGILAFNKPANLHFNAEWLPALGSSFSLMMEGARYCASSPPFHFQLFSFPLIIINIKTAASSMH